MYCGSCIRDNALAAELKRQGHDVILLPIYTPTLTDETNVSDERVFLGGISVYLEQHSALFRKTPWLLDRLWDSHWVMRLASKSSIAVDPRAAGRDDRLHAARRGWLPAQGYREADRVAAQRSRRPISSRCRIRC